MVISEPKRPPDFAHQVRFTGFTVEDSTHILWATYYIAHGLFDCYVSERHHLK